MKNAIYFIYLLMSIIDSSCSNDEPQPEVFMQVATITDETGSISQQISYDSYGRVIAYKSYSPDVSVVAEYEYMSDNLINIATHIRYALKNGDSERVCTFEDNLHLEKGRAVSCDGIFRQTEENRATLEKKYRHEFYYTSDNHLNTVKWTEWNKNGDGWQDDKPWTWENYYYWNNGNLVTIEDYAGQTYPSITYTFKYNYFSGIQNVVPIPMVRYQYIPLQQKGIFGSQTASLISEIHKADTFNSSHSTSYNYEIEDKRVVAYKESRNNGQRNTFSVKWIK